MVNGVVLIFFIVLVVLGALYFLGVFNGKTASVAQRPLVTTMFNELGLPPGTNWSITFAGKFITTTAAAADFSTPSGNYSYALGDAISSGCVYTPSSFSGSALAGYQWNVTYTISVCVATFTEVGLPNATKWTVSYDRINNSGTGTAITFFISPGTFIFTVGAPTVGNCTYNPSPSSGDLKTGNSQQIIYYGSRGSCK